MIGVAVVVGVSVALAAVTAFTTASTRWHSEPRVPRDPRHAPVPQSSGAVGSGAVGSGAVESGVVQRSLERRVRRSSWLRRVVHERVDRWSAGTLLLVFALAVLFAVALVIGLLLDMIDRDRGLARADGWVARWGAEHATAGSTTVIEGITHLGARPAVLAALVLAAWWDSRRRRNREVFAFVAVVGLGEMLLVNGLKLLVERDRPDVLRLVDAGGHSFPSGHTSAAAAAWISVALVLGRARPRGTRVALSSAAVAIAAAVATSRALLGVHWLTDVVGGLALGWGWYLVVSIAFGGRRQRLGAPLRSAAPDLVGPHTGDLPAGATRPGTRAGDATDMVGSTGSAVAADPRRREHTPEGFR